MKLVVFVCVCVFFILSPEIRLFYNGRKKKKNSLDVGYLKSVFVWIQCD